MPVKHPSSQAIAIEVDHVSFSYGSERVLDQVSFAIPEGQYVGVVGPNGGGKTTIIKIMMGLLAPEKGSVLIYGHPPQEARKRGQIGYVPQRVAQAEFPFPATVEEIVRSGRTPVVGIGKWLKAEDYKHIEHAMEITGVARLKERLVGTLSGGERQKVFIARALASQPKILILDEPTTGVDASSKEQFYALLKKLNTTMNITILFVSHDIEVMTNEVGFVLALNQKLLCHCASHEILSEEMLKRLYGRDLELNHPHHH
jgi:zinc transport system ATP-binding protein